MEKKRSDIIADEIEAMIFDGTFSDGQRLDENRLAHQFSVSRTPLREAFQRLAVSGLVEQIPRRGVFVRQPGAHELMQMFELMAELEASCARFAAMRISDAALADLHAANAECIAALKANDVEHYYQVNEKFHAIIYRAAGNEFLERDTIRLHRRLKPFRRMQLRARGRLEQSMCEHAAILKALDDSDAVAASNAIRDHVAVQGEKFYHLTVSLQKADR